VKRSYGIPPRTGQLTDSAQLKQTSYTSDSMSYQAAIESLSAMTPELHTNPGQPRRKFSLDEFRALMAALGNPQNLFFSVLIAGTNGKGSTASTLASIASASGVRTGLYTSPHLERVNERIRISAHAAGEPAFLQRLKRGSLHSLVEMPQGGLQMCDYIRIAHLA